MALNVRPTATPPGRRSKLLSDQPLPPPPPAPCDEPFHGIEMSRRAVVLNLAALVLLLSAATAFLWLMSSLPRIEGRVPVQGLDLPATISRDASGIPQITARSAHDAYFALGWAHAQDRIWQMELQRRAAAGRLAEIVGPSGLANDRFMRTLGLHRRAAASLAHLDKATRAALEAYAAGVNAWLDAHRWRLPLEFLLLGVRPQPWSPVDSLAWARLMGLRLAGDWRDDLLRAGLAGHLDAARMADLFPGYPADAPVTLSARLATAVLAAVPPAARPHLASNMWVVAGRLTASGKPLLANDPHLGFRAPILWYLASIDAPGLSVAGATVPGSPFVLVGHNQHIAWGTTSTGADTVDLFVEKLTGDGGGIVTPAGPRPFAVHREVIKVRGGADVTLSVRDTPDGPVVSDLLAPGLVAPGEVLALRSTALAPDDDTPTAFYRLQRAGDWHAFLGALRDFGSPVQNFTYADRQGNIGFATAGRVPVRRGGDGSLPMPGWTGAGAWTGWVPFDALPRAYNPKSGVLVNANNALLPPGGQPLITADWPEGYRAQRIAELLAGRTGLTPADMAAMQMDTLSLADVQIKTLLAGVRPDMPLAREAARMVAAWDGHADAGRPEPLIYNAWIDQLWHDLFAGALGTEYPSFALPRPYVLARILTRSPGWCADAAPDRPSCDTLAARSLETAIAALVQRHGRDLHAWRWGSEHQAVFANPVLNAAFGRVPGLATWLRIEAPTGGDDATVNRGTFRPGSFIQVHGAGLRAVYDLADLDASRFVIATGQSGNVLSRHYADLFPDWLANRGHPVTDPPPDAAALSLEPEY